MMGIRKTVMDVAQIVDWKVMTNSSVQIPRTAPNQQSVLSVNAVMALLLMMKNAMMETGTMVMGAAASARSKLISSGLATLMQVISLKASVIMCRFAVMVIITRMLKNVMMATK